MAPRALAPRRAEIPGRLPAFRLRQPGRAEGRPRAPRRPGHVRQFQPRRRRREGRGRDRPRRSSTTRSWKRRRTRSRPTTASSPRRCAIRRTIPPSPIACARRRAGTTASRSRAEDVIFSFETLKANSPQYAFYYKNVAKAEKTGDRRGHLHLRRKPATASCRRSSASSRCCRSTGGRAQAPDGRRRNPTADHARAAARLRPLPPEELRRRPHRHLRARERLLGPRPAGEPSAGTISTRSATSTTATRPCCSKPSRATATTSGPRTAPATGRPPTISRRSGRAASSGKNSRCGRPGTMQAFVFNLRRARVPGRRACAAPSTSPSISRTSTARSSTASTARIDSFFAGTELASSGLPQGKELAILEGLRDKVPAAVFTEPYRNPVNGSPEKVRGEPARGRAAAERGGLGAARTSGSSTRDRRALRGRVPRLRPEPRALRPALQARRSSGSASRCRSAPSTRRSTRTGCAASTST